MYGSRCDCCGGEVHDLADDTGDWDKIYEDIARQLLNGEDLNTAAIYNKTAAQLIAAMNNGLGGTSFDDGDSRQALQNAFKANLKEFSYAKTLTQFKLFKEAMFNDKGQTQSFETVKKAVADTGNIFNKNYLAAEHQFVTQSAIMAHKWETLDSEYLEFTTVGDSRVRLEHKLFDKFTALKTDPIWRRLYTPLDWGCRCTVIPGISKNVSKEYDSKWANEVVDPLVKGTIFDNNVGISKVIFTDKHTYYKAKPSVLKMVNSPSSEEVKVARKAKDLEIKEWAKANIPEIGKIIKEKNFQTGEIHISRASIKSIGDHFSNPDLKEVSKHIVIKLKECKYIDSAPLNPESHNYEKKLRQGVTKFHYYEFEWNKQFFRLNTEEINGKIEKPYAANLIIKK